MTCLLEKKSIFMLNEKTQAITQKAKRIWLQIRNDREDY